MYTYKYGGQKGQTYQLVEAKDLVVIRTKEDVELRDLSLSKTSRSLIPGLLPVAAFPEANVTVYRCVDKRENVSAESLRNNVRRNLNTEDGIRFAGRVLKDSKTGTIYVYTENFFLKFNDYVKKEHCEAIIKKMGLDIKELLAFAPNAYFLEASEGTGSQVFDIAHNCLDMKEVEYCHPELVQQIRHKAIHPMQWHLSPTNINGQNINQHVSVEGAWAVTKGEGTVIAIIDDGVDVSHEEFNTPGKIVAPRDTIRNSNNASPKGSTEMHGMACAGVACANGNHKASGVAPEAKLMPIRFGGLGSVAEAKAFSWAADNGADVISCSWGPPDGNWSNPNDLGHFRRFDLPDSSRLAIDYAINTGRGGKGCVILWAAGNGNENVGFDGYASYPKVIAVAACNDRGRRSVYSDFGNAIWCSFPSRDFFFPLLNQPRPLSPGIWTTDRPGNQGYNGGSNSEFFLGNPDNNYTATFGGTSSSCPGVAGIAALILSVNPGLAWDEVKEIIKNSCDRIDETFGNYDAQGHSPFYGYGRTNAEKAVLNAKATLEEEEEVLKVKGIAHFKRLEMANIADGQSVASNESGDRLLGIQLEIDPFMPGLSIRYQVVINNIGPLDPVQNGAFCGITDKRRKLIGFNVELIGSLSDNYDVIYHGRFGRDDEVLTAQNGAFCGSASGRGDALEGVNISILKK